MVRQMLLLLSIFIVSSGDRQLFCPTSTNNMKSGGGASVVSKGCAREVGAAVLTRPRVCGRSGAALLVDSANSGVIQAPKTTRPALRYVHPPARHRPPHYLQARHPVIAWPRAGPAPTWRSGPRLCRPMVRRRGVSPNGIITATMICCQPIPTV
jgi:hypothetical protein